VSLPDSAAAEAVQSDAADAAEEADEGRQLESERVTQEPSKLVMSNNALLAAIAVGDVDNLTVVLKLHSESADMAVVKQATTFRKDLKEKQRKLRLKVEKVNRSMFSVREAMASEIGTGQLAAAIEAADGLLLSAAAAGSGLEQLLLDARLQLECLRVDQNAAHSRAAIENVEQEFDALAMSNATSNATAVVTPEEEEDLNKLCVVCLAEPMHLDLLNTDSDRCGAASETDCAGSDHPATAALESPAVGGVDDNSEDECCVCLSAPNSHVCVPCGHKCLCADCSDLIGATGKCPVCQSKITMVMKIYG